MLSLFNSVKDSTLKSDQVREITRPGKTREKQRTPAAVALDKTTSLQRQLKKLDMATVEKAEKGQLLVELKALKGTIDKLLK
ncbi:MAG: hypothetical protein A4E65_00081 [Syntrophorhabdus sp. PtaU1.Bin153]|nr:MAG: hypothetical protein A4E65_00081 [Syntrophorhabdus sp. PtaU1.Bin153]